MSEAIFSFVLPQPYPEGSGGAESQLDDAREQ